MNEPDPEWKIVQAFCNHILKEGMKREAVQMKEAMDRSREYRRWLKHRCKRYWKEKIEEENP